MTNMNLPISQLWDILSTRDAARLTCSNDDTDCMNYLLSKYIIRRSVCSVNAHVKLQRTLTTTMARRDLIRPAQRVAGQKQDVW